MTREKGTQDRNLSVMSNELNLRASDAEMGHCGLQGHAWEQPSSQVLFLFFKIRSCSVDHASLELSDPPASTSSGNKGTAQAAFQIRHICFKNVEYLLT